MAIVVYLSSRWLNCFCAPYHAAKPTQKNVEVRISIAARSAVTMSLLRDCTINKFIDIPPFSYIVIMEK